MANHSTTSIEPGLFGLNHTNRDFRQKEAWGKNQFNSAFPAALCAYLAHQNKKSVYLSLHGNKIQDGEIDLHTAFAIDPNADNVYYAFEAQFHPYQRFIIGTLPRTDLVIQDRNDNHRCLSAFEIKLTALPDNTTCHLPEENYGCEIVVRPDTIVYLACSLADQLHHEQLNTFISPLPIEDWSDARQLLPYLPIIVKKLQQLAQALEVQQKAFLLQPIWKTLGKSPVLAENCLDVFFWSNAAFTAFITEIANPNGVEINRQTRTAIWLYKMLEEIAVQGRFDYKSIIDRLSYNTKNDKAFAANGMTTNRFMRSPRLRCPIVTKQEIQRIILGGGQELLSPERRFDAIIFNSPDLFI